MTFLFLLILILSI